jgi:hypothetical protein
MQWWRTVLLLLCVPLLISCDDDPVRPDIEVSGSFRLGFETSALDPCRWDQSWWVTNPGVFADRYEAIAAFPGQAVFVSVVGVKSKPGRYGHLGAYVREFEVTEVREVRKLVDGDCR